MDMKEKLVKLQKEVYAKHYFKDNFHEAIADELIANGVTVLEWISVNDRLPEEPLQTVLVTNGKDTCVAVYSVVYDEFGVMCGKGKSFGVTHWMPLPQPPKEEL